MTKPAAAFMQILGVLAILISIGAGSWLIALAGVGLIIWGGAATRRRIRQESAP